MKLTKAQIANLEHVRDHGRATPRSASGYWCRRHGLSEWVWLFTDGVTAAQSEREPEEGAGYDKIIGERLTPAGRQALGSKE